MARKFFYVCAGMLMLALSYHFGASTVGAENAGLATQTEVAVLSGVLRNGETIPLPTYADGTTALESECRWTVSNTAFGVNDVWCFSGDAVYPESALPPNTHDFSAFVTAHPGRVVNAGHSGSGGTYAANYIVIATRMSAGPTGATRSSWGQVKQRYAPNHGATRSEADKR